jgi:hypothetical protein
VNHIQLLSPLFDKERLKLAGMQVDAYNAAIVARCAERKAALLEQQTRKRGAQSDKEWERQLTGWLEKRETGWRAYKRIDGKTRLRGIFKTIGEAARAQGGTHDFPNSAKERLIDGDGS